MGAISTANAGLKAAEDRLYGSAQRIGGGGADYAAEAVEQISAKEQFQGSAAVIRTADAMFGSLLDIFA